VKGFYSPIDRAAEQLPRTKGTGAEFMTELSKRPGYKPQEAQDRELQTLMALPKMERAQFLAQLKTKPAPKLEDTTLTSKSGRSKYEDYSLPGGSNYREILLRMPHDEQRAKEFSDPASGHWDQPNVLAHVRAKDRTGPNGEKILHLEEIQSDWHQQGRDRGYATPESLQQFKAAQLAHRRLKEQLEEAKGNSENIDRKLSGNMPLYQDPEVRQRMEAAKVEHNNRIMDLMPQVMKAQAEAQDLGHKLNNVVPNAPFKKNWHELALKKMIHHAAANGYDSIAITPGAEQAKRYSLSRQVGRITHMTHSDTPDKGILFAFDPKGNQIVENHNVFHKDLPRYIGKEGAQKLLEQKPDEHGYRELSGQNLEVGGEGMKGFYDKMVPSFLNQFGKKYGAQVGTMHMPVGGATEDDVIESFPGGIHDAMRAGDVGARQYIAKKLAEVNRAVPLHHLPITPEMREDVVKNGVPLYADGGSVEDMQDTARQNDMYPDIEKYLQTRDAMPDVQISSNLPEGTNGMFSSINLPIGSGQLKINKSTPKQILPSVLTHEMAHAADRQMMQQAMEQGMFGKSNQFTEAYQKLVGLEGRNRTDLARKINPDWASDNQYYRALPQEIAAHGVGAFSGPNTQDRAPKHVDATAATEFQILLDLAQRNADKGPQGLAKIPAFFSKIGKYAKGGSVEGEEPKKTVKAYKMFRVDKKQPGKLFPLFVDSQTPVEMDKWITAKEGEKSATNAKKVKSKIGDLAYRPGWHAGDLPIATHIGDKDEEQKAEARRIRELRDAHAAVLGDTKAAKAIARKEHPYPSWVNAPRLRNPNHIWAEVEMPNDVDWQSEATKRGTNDQGKLIASQAHITDQLPLGGHYRYKTNSNMLGNWLIGGSMKVNRILHDKEVEAINKAAGAADLPRAKAMNQKAFGFAEGGTVAPDEWMAEEHVNHKAKPIGYTKEKVTVSPNLDQMRYELMSVKHYVKKAK